MWSEALGGLDHASRASELAPICGGCCRADCHSLRRLHPMTRFFRAPPYGDRNTTFPHGRRQREPEGRSPARSAGKAKRSACRAREDYGWGWAGRCNQAVPRHPPNTPPPNTRGSTSQTVPPAPPPNHPRQHKPHGATQPAAPGTPLAPSLKPPHAPLSTRVLPRCQHGLQPH
jgi:hypothetical protein